MPTYILSIPLGRVIANGTVGPPGSIGARAISYLMKKEYQRCILVVKRPLLRVWSDDIWLMTCVRLLDKSVARIFYDVLRE